MAPASGVTSGAAFKTAVRGTLLLAVLLFTGMIAFFYGPRGMIAALEDRISEDQGVLLQVDAEAGEAGLMTVIDGLHLPLANAQTIAGGFGQNRRKLAGDIGRPPDRPGWLLTRLILPPPALPGGGPRSAVQTSPECPILAQRRDHAAVRLQSRA